MRRLILFFVAGFLALGAVAQDQAPDKIVNKEVPIKSSLGRMGLGLPQPSSAGRWDGTWMYISRDVRMALWMKEDEGKPVAKFRFEGTLMGTEAFETDWTGSARYFVQDHQATFDFTITEAGPDAITAGWDWILDMRGSSRTEKSEIDLYRSGDGRRLVMHFKDFERIIESGGKKRILDAPQAWTFRKMSRRLVLWEELPF